MTELSKTRSQSHHLHVLVLPTTEDDHSFTGSLRCLTYLLVGRNQHPSALSMPTHSFWSLKKKYGFTSMKGRLTRNLQLEGTNLQASSGTKPLPLIIFCWRNRQPILMAKSQCLHAAMSPCDHWSMGPRRTEAISCTSCLPIRGP